MCLWLCATSVHNTTQNSSDNLPDYLQTNIIAQMLSIGGELERGEPFNNCVIDSVKHCCWMDGLYRLTSPTDRTAFEALSLPRADPLFIRKLISIMSDDAVTGGDSRSTQRMQSWTHLYSAQVRHAFSRDLTVSQISVTEGTPRYDVNPASRTFIPFTVIQTVQVGSFWRNTKTNNNNNNNNNVE